MGFWNFIPNVFCVFRWRCFVRLENIPSIGQENLLKLTPGFLCLFNLVHDVVWEMLLRIYMVCDIDLTAVVLLQEGAMVIYFHGYRTWTSNVYACLRVLGLVNSTSYTGIYRYKSSWRFMYFLETEVCP